MGAVQRLCALHIVEERALVLGSLKMRSDPVWRRWILAARPTTYAPDLCRGCGANIGAAGCLGLERAGALIWWVCERIFCKIPNRTYLRLFHTAHHNSERMAEGTRAADKIT